MLKIKTFPLNRDKTPKIDGGASWRDWNGPVTTPIFGVIIPRTIFIVDVDLYKGVTRGMIDALIGVVLPWQQAELQMTQNGGVHYAFRVPADANLMNSSNIGGLVGFDTRASGKGYIASGAGYESLTPFGVIETLAEPELFPELPEKALAFFKAGVGSNRTINTGDDAEDGDDLLAVVVTQPLDFTPEQVAFYMGKLTAAQAEDSKTWLDVMFGLYHQTQGSDEGWALFDAFSRLAPEKYNRRENRKRWESAGKQIKSNPITFASVVKLAGGLGGEVMVKEGGFFDRLLVESSQVETLEQYSSFKSRICGLSEMELGSDLRGMLAHELYISYGKNAGITKGEIKGALMPPKKGRRTGQDDTDGLPDWVEGWVYIEKTCEFTHVDNGHGIKAEAFNAKYSRMVDCVMAEKPASTMALINYRIPTYLDVMFWPGAEKVITYNGCEYLNSYRPDGVTPADPVSEEGLMAVCRMLAHVRMTLRDEREQNILLDWITFVYQNPGKRVNWALLLQGGYGTGKSYYSVLMQRLMGRLVTNIDPQAIAGRFTGWAHGFLVGVIEEIRINGTNKYEIMDRMKPFISNETVQIEEKGRDHRTVPNFTSYFMLTNHKDAIPLVAGDRRICVMFGDIQTEQQLYDRLGGIDAHNDYFEQLFADLAEHGDAIAAYFKQRKISPQFRANGRAPDTSAKQVMLSVSTSPEQQTVVDMIETHHCAVINDGLLDVTWLRALVEMEDAALPHPRALSAILLELGYEPVPGKRVKVLRTRENHYVWFNPSKTTADAAKNDVRMFQDSVDLHKK